MVKIQGRRDTAVNWALSNPVLAAGERGFDITNNLFKIGNGVSAWQDLPEFNSGSIVYMGTWDASSGSYPSSPEKGWYYVCSGPGTVSSITYAVGDWIVYNGTSWNKIDNQSGSSTGVSKSFAIAMAIALG